MAILGRGRRAPHGRYLQPLLTPYDVLDRSFALRRIGTGYDPDEVDDFLDSVAAAMAGLAPRVTAFDIRQHEFQLTKKVNSFDCGEVDDFLELIAKTLEVLDQGLVQHPEIDMPPPSWVE
ncbi:MAG: DivIVA domain-containing protein [Demequinaceae bacterium]|nr:DivIVA domain-containing protein [Demequinaceae bacterium]